MKISILAVGKIKEKFYRDACDEYMKRLTRYCKPEILEVSDEKTPDEPTEAEKNQVLEREAVRTEKNMKPGAYTIALAIEGKKMDSEAFSECIEKLGTGGVSHIQFMIGGSLGIHPSLMKKADMKISFSDMTFPHQLMRVILLEQIYRGYRIMNHEPYHK